MQGDYESRVVCVWAGVYGSGYLIAPSLVLTAGHAAKEVSGRVLFAHEDEWWDCKRVWYRDDDEVDAALLEISDPDWLSPVLEPVRWGRLTGSRSIAWDSVGFPDVERLADGLRETSHLTGTVNPGTRLRGGRYAGQIAAVPARSTTESPWAGLSGAPFVCRELLAGVIIEDSARWASGRVEAVPVSALANIPAFKKIVEKHTATPMVIESVELSGLLEQPRARGIARSPASLLRADAATVRFRKRKDLLNKLARWCRGDGVSVRLIIGPGGQGKTRFSREFATHMQRQNWVTGWLKPSPETKAGYGLVRQIREPVLFIIDYADTRAEEVARLLSTLLEGPARSTVRVLLLARSSGEWWERVKSSAPGIRELVSDAAIDLPPLETGVDGRRSAFTEAVTHLAAGLGEISSLRDSDWRSITAAIGPPDDLDNPRYEAILAIHMAALAALLKEAATAESQGKCPVEDVLLDHEQHYWEQTASAYGVLLHPRSMQRAVAVAALTEASTEADAMAVCASVPGLGDKQEDEHLAIALWLHDLYPGAPGAYWMSLQPDRLADHLIGKVATATPDLLARLLPALPVACLDRALTVLGRAWTFQPELADRVRQVILQHPQEVAVAAARAAGRIQDPAPIAAALDSILDQEKLSLSLVSDLFLAVPPRVRVMAPIAMRVSAPLASWLKKMSGRDPDKFMPSYGWILSQICARMWHARMRDETALAIGERAVIILRRLADPGDERDRLNLGEALNILAIQLAENERHEEALAIAQEAVTIHRQAPSSSSQARFGLAAALNTATMLLTRLGSKEDALRAVDEAILLARGLSPNDGIDEFSILPGCLRNRAAVLGALQRYPEAVETVDEAIRSQRPLAQMRPDPHVSDLARMIQMRARWMTTTQRSREALECCAEILTLLHKLTATHPEANQPEFPRLLLDTAIISAALGDSRLAADAATDAVALNRRLANALPGDYRVSLGDSLTAQAEYLRMRGELISARQAAVEALGLARELTQEDRPANLFRLADALTESATCYRELERPNQALTFIREVVTYRRELAADQAGSTRDELAGALNRYSSRLAETGSITEAGPPIVEAVEIRRRLAQQEPAVYEPLLAASLNDLAGHLLRAGDYEDALTIADQAVVVRRNVLDRRGGTKHRDTDLAILIGTRGTALAKMARNDEAMSSYNEAIEIHGPPVDGSSQLTLVYLLSNKASLLDTSGAPKQAMAIIEQAIRLQRKQLPGQTVRNQSQRIRLLEVRSQILLALNRADEAYSALHEARALANKLELPTGEIDSLMARTIQADPRSSTPHPGVRMVQWQESGTAARKQQEGKQGKLRRTKKKRH